MENIRLVQLFHPIHKRRVAFVKEPSLVLIDGITSIYELALDAIHNHNNIKEIIKERLSDEELDYAKIYEGKDDWKLLPSFDNPDKPLECLVSGTGLTHKNSALNRQMMHQTTGDKPTDSITMYQWGVEGGFPKDGEIGVQPEWFYKGNGSILKGHGESLEVPSYANDGGEEPELAGVYVVDKNGTPWRIGFSTGNEFSDHIMEKKNYLYLAPSKLRECAIGPELVIDGNFKEFKGQVSVLRNGQVLWNADIKTGESNMAHNLANLEYHHFKYAQHRIPLQAHVHFYGADAFSFGSQIKLQDGDIMSVEWHGMGRALRNPLRITTTEEKLIEIKSF